MLPYLRGGAPLGAGRGRKEKREEEEEAGRRLQWMVACGCKRGNASKQEERSGKEKRGEKEQKRLKVVLYFMSANICLISH